MKKKGSGEGDGREEGGARKVEEGAKRGNCPHQVAEQAHNNGRNGTNNVSEHGAPNGTNNHSSNGHARHANGQRTAGSVHTANGSHHPTNGSLHPTNGSYANPLNASALPTHSSASNSLPTPLLLPTYPWDNESDEER